MTPNDRHVNPHGRHVWPSYGNLPRHAIAGHPDDFVIHDQGSLDLFRITPNWPSTRAGKTA